jgi:hypothetical protein
LSAVCLFVAGVVAATLPTREFTLHWRHSVEKTRWEERYRIDDRQLTLTSASIEALGAGMESPPDAQFSDGRWTWAPMRRMNELTITRSSFTADYAICWAAQCRALGALLAESNAEIVTLRVC